MCAVVFLRVYRTQQKWLEVSGMASYMGRQKYPKIFKITKLYVVSSGKICPIFHYIMRGSNTPWVARGVESKTVYRLRLKNSLCCCTLAEYFAVDEKRTIALSVYVSFQKYLE